MYVIFHLFITGLFWGIYRGRLTSEWGSFHAMIGFQVFCWALSAGAVFLFFTSPLTIFGGAVALAAGGLGALAGFRSQG